MKQLSINHISAASIRANRKTYLSLAVGIVLAVLLATVMTLCAFGLIKALERKAVQIVGWTDCILLDEPDITDESLRQSGLFDRIGHQFVAASVTDSNVYLGWLDEAGQDVLCRAPAEGRMPEQRGEIAIERSALERLRLESEIGDTVTWTLLPVDGVPEERSFTIVGILREQSGALDVSGFFWSSDSAVRNWPAALISPEEAFATGRVAAHRAMTYASFTGLSQVKDRYDFGDFFGVSRTQAKVEDSDPARTDAAAYAQTTAMLFILGGALLLAVCIGISSAMEGVLASKTEEIGMLRAVGATKRQIRRIFGNDLCAAPLAAVSHSADLRALHRDRLRAAPAPGVPADAHGRAARHGAAAEGGQLPEQTQLPRHEADRRAAVTHPPLAADRRRAAGSGDAALRRCHR